MTTVKEIEEYRRKRDEEKESQFLRKKERAVQMAKLRYDEGLTLQAIGTRYGLTRERVRQIINDL